MNANELKQIDFCNPDSTHYANSEHYIAQLEAMISQQQAEIEALKKRCLDEIFKTTYADRSAEVMCEQWEKAQSEIEALKDIMVVAIKSGDWVVDGACDPDQYIGNRL